MPAVTDPARGPAAPGRPPLLATPQVMAVDEPLALDCGRALPRYSVNYETYGTLSPDRDNAVLVCHSLTKDAHAAGHHADDGGRPGWWDAAIGPGRMLDTDSYFVVCADTLSAGRSTGPWDVNPATGRRYGLDFPVLTVHDMVKAQRRLLEHLGIDRLHAVVGGCFGGQQAIELVIRYPEVVRNAVVIATTPATSAHSIAIFTVMRHLIRSDPKWNGGDYYGGDPPAAGVNSAVAAAIPLWMSRQAMAARFDRRVTRLSGRYGYSLDPEFAVEAFVTRTAGQARPSLDPNGLMYLTRAVEYFDLDREYGSLAVAFAEVSARVLFVSYRGDWRYPAEETARMHDALRAAGGRSTHAVLDSPLGHGAFLYDLAGLAELVGGFLTGDGRPGTTGAP